MTRSRTIPSTRARASRTPRAAPSRTNDTAALETILRSCRDKYAKVLIVAEGVYSMDGDIAPVPELVRIKKEYGCFLMIDEAHSACVLGRTGGRRGRILRSCRGRYRH